MTFKIQATSEQKGKENRLLFQNYQGIIEEEH